MGVIVIGGSMMKPDEQIVGGTYWSLPIYSFIAIGFLLGISLFSNSRRVRLVGIVSLAAATMGSVGILEPWGVFHDSWRNVGLGELAFNSGYVESVRQVSYLSSAPGSFLYYGVVSSFFPDIPSFLRIYPLICVVIYGLGIYLMITAFAQTHRNLPVNQIDFAQMSVLAFIALSPVFLVRINPSPQSLAFALIPFFIAAITYGKTALRFRVLAVCIFIITVFIHPISAFEMILLIALWWISERILRSLFSNSFMISINTILLFVTVFLSWAIYIGIWVLTTGRNFLERILDVVYLGQHTTPYANSMTPIFAFIWIHRLALGGAFLLVALGLISLIKQNRMAGVRLVVWFITALIWLPLLLFGEFADRGQLFASLPAALVIGFILSYSRSKTQWVIRTMVLFTALASFATAYSDHIGEVISPAEVSGFESASARFNNNLIVYGYVPPLDRDALPLYSTDQIRVLAQGAADFSFARYSHYRNTDIVLSDQMRASAAQRGFAALSALDLFYNEMFNSDNYILIFDNGFMKIFHTK